MTPTQCNCLTNSYHLRGEGEGFFSKETGFSGVDYDAENGVLIFPDPRDGGESKLTLHTLHLFDEIQRNERGEPRQHPLQKPEGKFKGDVIELSRFIICFLDRMPYFPTPESMSQRYNKKTERLKKDFEELDQRKEADERRAYLQAHPPGRAFYGIGPLPTFQSIADPHREEALAKIREKEASLFRVHEGLNERERMLDIEEKMK